MYYYIWKNGCLQLIQTNTNNKVQLVLDLEFSDPKKEKKKNPEESLVGMRVQASSRTT